MNHTVESSLGTSDSQPGPGVLGSPGPRGRRRPRSELQCGANPVRLHSGSPQETRSGRAPLAAVPRSVGTNSKANRAWGAEPRSPTASAETALPILISFPVMFSSIKSCCLQFSNVKWTVNMYRFLFCITIGLSIVTTGPLWCRMLIEGSLWVCEDRGHVEALYFPLSFVFSPHSILLQI